MGYVPDNSYIFKDFFFRFLQEVDKYIISYDLDIFIIFYMIYYSVFLEKRIFNKGRNMYFWKNRYLFFV